MIEALLKQSFENALTTAFPGPGQESEGTKNARLSELWVESLAEALRGQYNESDGYRVFSKKYTGNKSEFKIQEFLYDITVVGTRKVLSANGKTWLEYPHEIIWHIESEFHAHDSRESMVDFGKLMMSGAQERLLILPSGENIEEWAKELLFGLRNDTPGSMRLAFLPHPKRWGSSGANDIEVTPKW